MRHHLRLVFGLLITAMIVSFVACSLHSGGAVDPVEDGSLPDTAMQDTTGMPDASDSPIGDASVDQIVDSPADAPPLAPNQVAGLEFWVRSDQITLDDAGTVLSWPDRSGKNDPNRNALPLAGNEPKLLTDAGYNGWPVLSFFPFNGNTQGQWLQTGTWSNQLPQPLTMMVVGEGAKYFVDSLNPAIQVAVLTYGGELRMYAGNYVPNGGSPLGQRVIMAVFSGNASALHNSKFSPTSTGNSGPNLLRGLTLGSYAQVGPAFTLNGYLAEVAVWSRALTTSEIRSLNQYAEARYAIPIAQ